jgi:O-antigen/teichoic acid export membrane protein
MIFRRLANDSMVYGGVDFLIKSISFFTFPLIAVALTPAAFGVLDLILTATALLGIVAGCGLYNSVQRFYWDQDTTAAMRPQIVTSGLYAQFAFALLVVTLGLITIPWLIPFVERAELPFTWIPLVSALLLVALNQSVQFRLDVVRLHFAPWNFFTLSLISRGFSIGFGLVAVVFLGLGIDGLLAAQVLGMLLIVPLALWMIRRDFQIRGFYRKWFVELVQFGHPFIYAGLAYWLLSSLDRWMLASMTTIEEVGTYSVAFRFASLVLFVSFAFGQAWSAVAIKIRIDYPGQYREIFGRVLLLFLFSLLITGGGVALFAGELISLIMPAEYIASALPLAILCFGQVIQST